MFLRYNLFTFLWAILVLLLTLTPGDSMPDTDIWGFLEFDKVAHLLVFAALVLLMAVGFSKQYTYMYLRNRAMWVSIVICIGYGLLIEGVQALIPERTLEYGDLLADIVGCGVGYAIFYGIYKS